MRLKHPQSGRPQCARPAVAGVAHHARLHPRVLQGKRPRNCRFPVPLATAAKHDRSGSSSLAPVYDGDIFLIRTCGIRIRFSPPPSVAFGGLVPHPENVVLGGLPFASSMFCFCAHEPPMRIDDLSVPSGRLVARESSTVTTVDHRPSSGTILPAADADFPSDFTIPYEGRTGSTDVPAAASAVTQHAPSQGADFTVITDPPASTPSPPDDPAPPTTLPHLGRISTRTRRQTTAAAATAPPAVDFSFWSGGFPRPSAKRATTPPRVPRPRPPLAVVATPSPAASPAPRVSIPSGRDRAENVRIPLLRLQPPPDLLSATTADSDAFGADAESQFGNSAARYSCADWAREQPAEPECHAAMH